MTRIVPKKNYIILVLLFLLVIFGCIAIKNVYDIYLTNRVEISPLAINKVLYKDLENSVKDLKADTFLVISYKYDRNVYNAENKIKDTLKKYNLIDNVMYLDVTEYINEENFINELNKKLKLDSKIENLPAIVFYKENKVEQIIDSKKSILDTKKFDTLIINYIQPIED